MLTILAEVNENLYVLLGQADDEEQFGEERIYTHDLLTIYDLVQCEIDREGKDSIPIF